MDTYSYNSRYGSTLDLCNLNQASDCSNQDWTAGVNAVVPIYGVPVRIGLSGGEAKGRCQSLFSQYCRRQAESKSVEQSIQIARDLLNESVAALVVEAWQRCVRDHPPGGGDPKLVSVSGIPDRLGGFRLSVRFANASGLGLGALPLISDVETLQGVNCDEHSLRNAIGTPITGGGTEILCTRESADAGALTIRTTWGTTGVTIEKLAPTPAPPTAVIGITLVPNPYYLSDHQLDLIKQEHIYGVITWGGVPWQSQVWIAGTPYKHALGMHPEKDNLAIADFRIPRGARGFRSTFGLTPGDLQPNDIGDVKASVLIDGDLVWESHVNSTGAFPMEFPVRQGAAVLRLQVDPLGTNWTDHATWGDPCFYAQ